MHLLLVSTTAKNNKKKKVFSRWHKGFDSASTLLKQTKTFISNAILDKMHFNIHPAKFVGNFKVYAWNDPKAFNKWQRFV